MCATAGHRDTHPKRALTAGLDEAIRRLHQDREVRRQPVGVVRDQSFEPVFRRLDLFVVMEAGTHLPVMGATVQRRVADAIDRMLGLAIAEVNVFVSEVAFA